MAIFKYTLPSGSQFTVTAPNNTTQLQADKIFYEQVAAGSLVGYSPGQSLTSTASAITTFELSRLNRGTAGVTTVETLSTVGTSVAAAETLAATPGALAIIQGLPTVSGIPSLTNVPIQTPVDQADIILAKGDSLGPTTVGPLSGFQVQVLEAQIINLVDQPSTDITQDKGIGQYGFNCYQLEKIGYVKPGTSARLLDTHPDDFMSVMNSPSIWTGLNGATSLDAV